MTVDVAEPRRKVRAWVREMTTRTPLLQRLLALLYSDLSFLEKSYIPGIVYHPPGTKSYCRVYGNDTVSVLPSLIIIYEKKCHSIVWQ